VLPVPPAGPVIPVGPTPPVPPVLPVPPVPPLGPEAPVGPARPVPPVPPVAPVAPVLPVPPARPDGPEGPVPPVLPEGPVGPVGPDGPIPLAGVVLIGASYRAFSGLYRITPVRTRSVRTTLPLKVAVSDSLVSPACTKTRSPITPRPPLTTASAPKVGLRNPHGMVRVCWTPARRMERAVICPDRVRSRRSARLEGLVKSKVWVTPRVVLATTIRCVPYRL